MNDYFMKRMFIIYKDKIMDMIRKKTLEDENSKYHWPEYLNNEYGDEIKTCNKCKIDFYGYKCRVYCYVCSFEGSISIQLKTKLKKD